MYVRAPINKRLIVYPVMAVFLAAWIFASFLPVMKDIMKDRDTLAPQSKYFNLSFVPAFLYDSLALELAYDTLSQLGYQVRKWNPVEPARERRVKPPDGSQDVYLQRSTVNTGFIIFTNPSKGQTLTMTIDLSSNIVSCVMQQQLTNAQPSRP